MKQSKLIKDAQWQKEQKDEPMNDNVNNDTKYSSTSEVEKSCEREERHHEVRRL